jgi:hypothetical protein
MNPYHDKTYGRNLQVADLCRTLESGRNVSMHGQRGLGKPFVLDRMPLASNSFHMRVQP